MHTTWRRTALAVLATITPLASASPASAGTYTVLSCDDRNGVYAPISDPDGGWRPQVGPTTTAWLRTVDGCAYGNGMLAEIGGPYAFSYDDVWANWVFQTPTDTSIRGFLVRWDGYAIPTQSGKAGYLSVDTEDARYDGFAASGNVPLRTTSATGINAEHLTLHAGCVAGASRCGATVEGWDARMHVARTEVTLEDLYAPTGSASGDAIQRTTWYGPQLAAVDGADRGGGVASVSATVDGMSAGSRAADTYGGRCETRGADRVYASPRPCNVDPAAVELTVDPRPFEDGEHVVRFHVTDASGASSVVSTQTRTFDTRPPVLSGQASVSGSGREGDALTCNAPVATGQSPTTGFTWTRANADGSGRAAIDGATSQTYTPVAADVGRKLLCTFTATDGGGTASSESSLTDGPFANGGTVRGVCDGMPAGSQDPCGDLDADGTRNRDDVDADGDGVGRDDDPDDLDATKTGRDATPPPPPTTTTPPATPPTNTTTNNVSTTTNTTTTEHTRESAVIKDGPAGEPNGRFASPAATLTSHHEGTSSRTLRVRHGRSVLVTGRLLAPDGRGIAGAKLDVTTQDRVPGDPFKPYGSVLTADDGRYQLRIPAGPSRTVRIGYRAMFGDASLAQTTDLTVLVRAGLTFRLSHKRLRNGRTLRFSGKVLGPRSGHRFAEVMVRTGRRWIVVCSVRTDSKGAFACRHRFTKTFRRTKYAFRARVRRQGTLPYEPATTSVRTLVVRP